MHKGLLKHIGLIWLLRHPGTGLNISRSFFIYLMVMYDILLVIYDVFNNRFDVETTLMGMAIINIIAYAFYSLTPKDKKSAPTALLLVFISASFLRFIVSPTGFLSIIMFVWEMAAIFKVSTMIREKNL